MIQSNADKKILNATAFSYFLYFIFLTFFLNLEWKSFVTNTRITSSLLSRKEMCSFQLTLFEFLQFLSNKLCYQLTKFLQFVESCSELSLHNKTKRCDSRNVINYTAEFYSIDCRQKRLNVIAFPYFLPLTSFQIFKLIL